MSHGLKSKHIGGWTRLWIILSAVWIAGVLAWAYSEWPDRLPFSAAFPFYLSEEHQALINLGDESSDGIDLQIPNGYTLRCKRRVSENTCNQIGHAYIKIAMLSSEKKRKELLVITPIVALVPSIILAIIGFGIGWIRTGFKPS